MHDNAGGPSNQDPNYKTTCFPASTLILTPRGKVRIGDIAVGDAVLSMNTLGVLTEERVTRKLLYPAKRTLVVKLMTGMTLRSTDSHSFLTPNGWRRLNELQGGDTIMTVHGLRHISSIEPHEEVEPVMNLYTTGLHNFIADGCVAHNFTHLRWLRTKFHQLFYDRQPSNDADRLTAS
jgi:Pretoxin HINT domain